MKAKFIGDPNDDFSGPKVLKMAFGASGNPTIVLFPKDKFVGLPAELEANVVGNNHFVVEEGDAKAYAGPPPEAVEAAADAMDGDDDGRAGGSLTKADTLAKLDAMQKRHPEISFDPKWGLPKLRGVLEAAEFEYGDD